jgi:ABC-type glycerol-3-phosphate transport system substrate-binding protein
MKKKIALATAVLAAAGVGVAVALGGLVSGLDFAAGTASGVANSCQTASVNFSWTAPTFDSSLHDYASQTVTASNIDQACNSATLKVTVLGSSNTVLATGQAAISGTSEPVTLVNPVLASQMPTASIKYLIEG